MISNVYRVLLDEPLGKRDPYADYLLYDSFTDDDAVLIQNHTPEKAPEGSTWSAYGGSAKISSNTIVATGTHTKFRIDVGSANVIVTFRIKPTTLSYARAEMRRSSETDKISTLLRQDINQINMYYYDPGAVSIDAAAWSPTAGQWYDIEQSIDSAHDIYANIDTVEFLSGNEGGNLDGGTEIAFWLADGWVLDLVTVKDAG